MRLIGVRFSVMLSHIQLRDELIRLLDNEISLDQFDQWFAQESWNIHRSLDALAQRLAYAVELRLAEYDSGHLPEENLRRELLSLMRAFSLNLMIGKNLPISGSSSNFIEQTWAFQSADIQLSRASS